MSRHPVVSLVMFAASLSLVTACSVSELSSEMTAGANRKNTCAHDADCQSQAAMSASCGPGICVSADGDIEGAWLDIIPPASAFFGAGDSFLIGADNLSFGDWNRELVLPDYARIHGRVLVAPPLLGDPIDQSCASIFDPKTGSMAVHVEVDRWEKRLGIGASVFAANAKKTDNGWQFSLNIPPGKYDLTVSPLGGCEQLFPPLLVQGQTFGPGNVSFEQKVDSLSSLTGTAQLKTSGQEPPNPPLSLKGWAVSVVDPIFGKQISTVSKLKDTLTPQFSLRYQPVDAQSPALLKLTPPGSIVGPTMLWDLGVLDLDGDGKVGLNLQGLNLSKVHVKGRVLTPELSPAADVKVKFHSADLLGVPEGLRAWYETSVVSSSNGTIELDLLPGTYDLTASPTEDVGSAITMVQWKIASSPALQAGKTIALEHPHTIRGTLRTPQGTPLSYVKISTSPFLGQKRDYATSVLSSQSRPPRPANDTTLLDGSFALTSDAGQVVLTARPSPVSDFPWLVHAPIDTTAAGLGDVIVPFPIPLVGTLRDPNGNFVQQANIRVFVMLDAKGNGQTTGDPNLAGTSMLVAETQTDREGRFRLLLPSRLK